MIRLLSTCAVLAVALTASGGQSGDPKDPKSWTPVKIPGKQKAPEFEDIAEWINSDPLTMKSLKGKVVVIHFMAFG
jgi:hypothetical protein